jgi:anti-anti-sigma factor
MVTPLSINTEERGDGTRVLTASGEIDLSNVDEFSGALSAADTDSGMLVVDMTEVLYLDSGALNVLFANAGRIRLIANLVLMPVLQISGLTDVTAVESTA